MLGCAVEGFCSFRFQDTVWSSETPLAWCDWSCHLFRVFCRRNKMRQWLESQRRDAEIAQNLPLQINDKLIHDLHAACQPLDGWEVSTMAGGVTSDAKWHSRDFCRFCQQIDCPSAWHLFWECRAFEYLRSARPPLCRLEARLGWGQQGVSHCLKQMARIRRAAVKLRLSMSRNPDLPVPPDRGEGGGAPP